MSNTEDKKCVFVRWRYVDDDQFRPLYVPPEWCYEWFGSVEDAERWIAERKAGNGSYFEHDSPRFGSYDEWKTMIILEEQLAEIRRKYK